MNTEDWKSIGLKVAKAAPLIGGLLGGPVGTVVGTVGNMVASAQIRLQSLLKWLKL